MTVICLICPTLPCYKAGIHFSPGLIIIAHYVSYTLVTLFFYFWLINVQPHQLSPICIIHFYIVSLHAKCLNPRHRHLLDGKIL